MSDINSKYLKYKNKYIELKKQLGGMPPQGAPYIRPDLVMAQQVAAVAEQTARAYGVQLTCNGKVTPNGLYVNARTPRGTQLHYSAHTRRDGSLDLRQVRPGEVGPMHAMRDTTRTGIAFNYSEQHGMLLPSHALPGRVAPAPVAPAAPVPLQSTPSLRTQVFAASVGSALNVLVFGNPPPPPPPPPGPPPAYGHYGPRPHKGGGDNDYLRLNLYITTTSFNCEDVTSVVYNNYNLEIDVSPNIESEDIKNYQSIINEFLQKDDFNNDQKDFMMEFLLTYLIFTISTVNFSINKLSEEDKESIVDKDKDTTI
jgi:hypothetical protein